MVYYRWNHPLLWSRFALWAFARERERETSIQPCASAGETAVIPASLLLYFFFCTRHKKREPVKVKSQHNAFFQGKCWERIRFRIFGFHCGSQRASLNILDLMDSEESVEETVQINLGFKKVNKIKVRSPVFSFCFGLILGQFYFCN